MKNDQEYSNKNKHLDPNMQQQSILNHYLKSLLNASDKNILN